MIIDFSSSRDAALGDQERGAVTSMIANLVRTVRPIEEASTGPSETARILVVDDNASNRDLLFRRLSHGLLRSERIGRRAQRWQRVRDEIGTPGLLIQKGWISN